MTIQVLCFVVARVNSMDQTRMRPSRRGAKDVDKIDDAREARGHEKNKRRRIKKQPRDADQAIKRSSDEAMLYIASDGRREVARMLTRARGERAHGAHCRQLPPIACDAIR